MKDPNPFAIAEQPGDHSPPSNHFEAPNSQDLTAPNEPLERESRLVAKTGTYRLPARSARAAWIDSDT